MTASRRQKSARENEDNGIVAPQVHEHELAVIGIAVPLNPRGAERDSARPVSPNPHSSETGRKP